MRELKFRAFDTENKTWTFVTLGDLICGACTEKGDKPLSGAKQVWEQYAGLKDKNGKEIYEGDIVFIAKTDKVAEVEWSYDGVWKVRYPNLCYDKLYDFKNIEVIGNIHEWAEWQRDDRTMLDQAFAYIEKRIMGIKVRRRKNG